MKQIVTMLAGLCVALFSTSAFADGVTANVLRRVLALRNDSRQGTGFTVEVDSRQYIVTAGHMLPGTNQTAVIGVYHANEWKKLPVTVLRSAEADVAVLVPPKVLTPTMKIVLSSANVIFGQDVYFLGFPDMLFTDVPAEQNNGYPIPFIKRGILSALYKGKAKYRVILVDGINNPGFSGGPLVAEDSKSKDMILMGVVTAYKTSSDRVMREKADTGLRSLGNAGIIICYDIQYAIDEIKKHHNGPKVSSE